MLMSCTVGKAQRKVWVMDMDMLIPVVGANVINNNRNLTTDSLGLCCIPDSCNTLVVSHVNYESSIINLDEVGDTIFLLSKILKLPEVVVFGNGKTRDYSALQKSLKMDKVEAQLAAADPNGGFKISLSSVAKILPKKWRPGYRKEQRRKRLKEILDNY